MAGKIDGITPPFIPIGGIGGLPTSSPIAPQRNSRFQELLQAKLKEYDDKAVKFSAHAQSRIQSRNLDVSERQFDKLVDAVDQASAKGARESLILLNDMAFIVNVSKRTVVTAMDREGLQKNVFTNIDSAVVVPE